MSSDLLKKRFTSVFHDICVAGKGGLYWNVVGLTLIIWTDAILTSLIAAYQLYWDPNTIRENYRTCFDENTFRIIGTYCDGEPQYSGYKLRGALYFTTTVVLIFSLFTVKEVTMDWSNVNNSLTNILYMTKGLSLFQYLSFTSFYYEAEDGDVKIRYQTVYLKDIALYITTAVVLALALFALLFTLVSDVYAADNSKETDENEIFWGAPPKDGEPHWTEWIFVTMILWVLMGMWIVLHEPTDKQHRENVETLLWTRRWWSTKIFYILIGIGPAFAIGILYYVCKFIFKVISKANNDDGEILPAFITSVLVFITCANFSSYFQIISALNLDLFAFLQPRGPNLYYLGQTSFLIIALGLIEFFFINSIKFRQKNILITRFQTMKSFPNNMETLSESTGEYSSAQRKAV